MIVFQTISSMVLGILYGAMAVLFGYGGVVALLKADYAGASLFGLFSGGMLWLFSRVASSLIVASKCYSQRRLSLGTDSFVLGTKGYRFSDVHRLAFDAHRVNKRLNFTNAGTADVALLKIWVRGRDKPFEILAGAPHHALPGSAGAASVASLRDKARELYQKTAVYRIKA